MSVKQSELWYSSDLLVHAGFLSAYQALRSRLVIAVQERLNICPDCPLIFTGHSLGGAMATVGAVDLSTYLKLGPTQVISYTYGSPRVGNPAFVNLHKQTVGTSFRVVNKRDVVPRIPTHIEIDGIAYWHVPYEVWYPPSGGYVVCDSTGEDPTCSLSQNFLLCTIEDHSTYLGFEFAVGVSKGC
eukprot:TRINITY_DN4675_c0_g1_i9.p1 TRINITY_DN4675_c0_g1~~TRINITY_DN4675_c0_g1_i9.p1  ORF type:complete len:185 (-),score=32.37 TRINITY_DN4675_c0_g1_i9:89-643(-)